MGIRVLYSSVNYEDGLLLQVEQEWQKRTTHLQWRDETQGRTNDDFSTYVKEV